MKICMIGPGEMSIPPDGWGGVEALIWNYKLELEKQGHEVGITNSKDLNGVVQAVNEWKPDLYIFNMMFLLILCRIFKLQPRR